MPTFNDARDLILENVAPLDAELVELLESTGRVLAEDVFAPWNMPFCDNSAMDGFAVRAGDCSAAATLRIIGYIPAGAAPTLALEPNCAIKIMTGAPIPAGCDAVVPFEEAEERDGCVSLKARVKPRQHVRFTGEDVRCGENIVPSGTLVSPPVISMLASLGKGQVKVHRRPRVAILSTGDELVELGQPISPGKIINSNSYSLAAAVRELGADPIILGIARDNIESHRQKLVEGLRADVLITSAGVSAGDRDLVRDALSDLGVKQLFWRVDIKPGGPTAFCMKDDKPIFCLPGNPVATIITFEEFVRPALLKMMGHRHVLKPFVPALLQEEVHKKPGKIKFLRVRLVSRDGVRLAYSSGDQNTGMLKTMLAADAIAMLPAERCSFSPGDEVSVHILSPAQHELES